jgi:hypothetical protein
MKLRVFWDVLPCSQVDVDRVYLTAQHYIAEVSELNTRRRENLKSHNSCHVDELDVGREIILKCISEKWGVYIFGQNPVPCTRTCLVSDSSSLTLRQLVMHLSY